MARPPSSGGFRSACGDTEEVPSLKVHFDPSMLVLTRLCRTGRRSAVRASFDDRSLWDLQAVFSERIFVLFRITVK